jgi:hypothetical protein
MLKHSAKVLRVALPALVGVAVISAVVFGRSRGRREVTIPAGVTLVAALERGVSTERTRVGDNITLRTTAPIRLDADEVIPEGVVIRGTVTQSKGGGRVAGTPELALRFTDLEVDGDRYAISADPFRIRGKNDAAQSAAAIGGGAVVGGILGRVIGGKRSTVKGAVVGAVIGTGVAVATDGDELVLPAGQKLRVRLSGPVTVTYRPQSDTAAEK